jgi:hypothetical protein
MWKIVESEHTTDTGMQQQTSFSWCFQKLFVGIAKSAISHMFSRLQDFRHTTEDQVIRVWLKHAVPLSKREMSHLSIDK